MDESPQIHAKNLKYSRVNAELPTRSWRISVRITGLTGFWVCPQAQILGLRADLPN